MTREDIVQKIGEQSSVLFKLKKEGHPLRDYEYSSILFHETLKGFVENTFDLFLKLPDDEFSFKNGYTLPEIDFYEKLREFLKKNNFPA